MNGKGLSGTAWGRVALSAATLGVVLLLSGCLDEIGEEPTALASFSFESNVNCQPWCTSSTSGSNVWLYDSTTAGSGSRSIRSGTTASNGQSCITYTPGFSTKFVRFMYKLSTEENFDLLVFKVNSTTNARGSGIVDWSEYTYEGSFSSTRTYSWCYEKDGSLIAGQDAVWIDLVRVY